jgi:hypothetical protein
MSSLEVIKIQAEYIQQKDAKEFALGDVLDVKTSVFLAVIVFLAAQSDAFFHATPALSPWALRLQYISVSALILAGVFAVLELIPRYYSTETSPEQEEKWVQEGETYYADKPDAANLVSEEILKGRYQRTKERVQENIAVNKRKSWMLTWCFRFTSIAFAANLATLASRLFRLF